MHHRFLTCAMAALMVLSPALADDTTTNNSTSIAPANNQYVTPTTNQNAQTANVSTQINNQNLGANSFGQGITCQSAQVALGGFGSRLNSGVGSPISDTGVTVQYLTPISSQSNKSCQALASEVLRQRQLDTQLTTIQKCADFARAGIQLDPATYPELSRACAGIRLTNTAAPVGGNRGGYLSSDAPQRSSMVPQRRPIHISDFSPQHNGELRRIAMHRLSRIAMISDHTSSRHVSRGERTANGARLAHENARLRAVIAEVDMENSLLRHLMKDRSWRAQAGLRDRILSYNDQARPQ